MKKCTQCGEVKSLDKYPKTYQKNEKGETLEGRRANCRVCENKRRKKNYDVNPITRMFMNAKSRAKQAKIEFKLIPEDVPIPEFCPLLGVKLVLGKADSYEFAPSIDRIDSTKGYIKGNVKVVSLLANRMKNNATKEQCIAFSNNIIKYLTDDIV